MYVLPCSTSEKKVKLYPQLKHLGCVEHFFMSGFYICSIWYHLILMLPPTVCNVHIEYVLQRPALAPAGLGVVICFLLDSFHCKEMDVCIYPKEDR